MAKKILICTALNTWGESLLERLKANYKYDQAYINGPINDLINYPKLWKESIKDFRTYTHIIIIPYTLIPNNDPEMTEAIPIMLEEGRMTRAFEFLLANTQTPPKVIQLTNASKQDNWRLIVSFLSGIHLTNKI